MTSVPKGKNVTIHFHDGTFISGSVERWGDDVALLSKDKKSILLIPCVNNTMKYANIWLDDDSKELGASGMVEIEQPVVANVDDAVKKISEHYGRVKYQNPFLK